MTGSKNPLVHFYDTSAHRILCGVRGVDHRSTKHSHSVTCQVCLPLLDRRGASTGATADSDAHIEHVGS